MSRRNAGCRLSDQPPTSYKTEHPKKAAFLAAYAKTGNISAASRAADIWRGSHHAWLKDDAEYAAAFAEAKEQAIETMEAEALRRATLGTEEGVWYKGKRVGTERRMSDTLLIFLLKGARPEKYRDNQKIEHTGPNGGAIPISVRDATQRIIDNPDAYEAALQVQAALAKRPAAPTLPASDAKPDQPNQ